MSELLSIKDILLVSDIDGTIYRDDVGIPQRNIDAIKRYIGKGGNFTVATGRSPQALLHILESVPVSAPAIIFNGGALYDPKTDRFIERHSLPKEVKGLVKNLLEKIPHLGCEFLVGPRVYVPRMNKEILAHIRKDSLKYVCLPIDSIPDGASKIFFSTDVETMQKIREHIEQSGVSGVYAVQTEKTYFEIMPEGVNKALGLKALREYLNIDNENVYAIGDFYNDVEMLAAAGIGVCVENAPKEVKKFAKIVVCDCKNGAVADIIEIIEQRLGI